MKEAGPPSRRAIATGAAALVGSLALGAVALRSAWSNRAAEPSADAPAKGELVRHAVDEAYRALPIGTRIEWRDVSSLVAPHIPAGTSYDLAETILWHAGCGFTWARRTVAKPMDENLKRCPTLAVKRGLVLWPIGEFEVSIQLVPDRLANFDVVERTCAFIRGERWT